MRVFVVSHLSGKGGAERCLLETISLLRPRGFEFLVILPGPGPLLDDLRVAGVECRIIEHRPWVFHWKPRLQRAQDLLFDVRAAWRMATVVRAWNADVVYTNTILPIAGALAALLTRRKHIWRIYEFGPEDHGFSFFLGERAALRAVAALTDLLVCNAEAVATRYRKVLPPDRIELVKFCIELLAEYRDERPRVRAPQSPIRCLLAGSLHEGKRQEDAVRAVAELVREGVPVRLDIVGPDGNKGYAGDLRRLAAILGVQDQVSFVSEVPSVLPFIRESDVVLLTSRCEALARIPIEAFLMKRPVIGTRSGGTPEQVRDGENGLLYEPFDVSDLARKIRLCWERPDDCVRMGLAGYDWASRVYAPSTFADDIERALRRVAR